MVEETKWKLTRRSGRKYWCVRYMLAGTNKWVEQSTKKTRRRDAETAARKIIAKAEQRGAMKASGWAEFRTRYVSERLSHGSRKTLETFSAAANQFERLIGVDFVHQITAKLLWQFQIKLRDLEYSPGTIQAYRDHLMSALKWAEQVELIKTRPKAPPLDRGAIESRGRPLQREEAERIVMALPTIVGKDHAKTWAWNLEGLWRSGFRLGETLTFFWEPTPGMHWIENLDGDRPRIRISSASEKGKKDRTIPMTPDFVAMLRAVPPKRRKGPVFRWPLSRGDTTNVKTIGKRISAAGEAAGVVTGKRTKRPKKGPPKIVNQFATAHDFRRSFGARWAPKVMPMVLMCLMRHESIDTTRKFYTGRDSDELGDALWRVEGAVLGDMLDSVLSADIDQADENTVKHGKN